MGVSIRKSCGIPYRTRSYCVFWLNIFARECRSHLKVAKTLKRQQIENLLVCEKSLRYYDLWTDAKWVAPHFTYIAVDDWPCDVFILSL
jgi:hypothetical protein